MRELGDGGRGKSSASEGNVARIRDPEVPYKGTPALDAGLLAAAQAVEHYEISRYGTLKTWAQELGLDQSVATFSPKIFEPRRRQLGVSHRVLGEPSCRGLGLPTQTRKRAAACAGAP
jgi:Domain of unknown function (DUF892)